MGLGLPARSRHRLGLLRLTPMTRAIACPGMAIAGLTSAIGRIPAHTGEQAATGMDNAPRNSCAKELLGANTPHADKGCEGLAA
jgi:hypothetical protein